MIGAVETACRQRCSVSRLHIILALVAALVGPHFVDWDNYRGEFEARASRLTGLELRVAGPIDARLLPTPILMLHGIEIGRRRSGR